MRTRLQPVPINTNAVDGETARMLSDVDQFALKNLKSVARALIDKAKTGDKTASELVLRYLVAPIRERHEQRIQRQPSPTPINIGKALVFMNDKILDGKGQTLISSAGIAGQLTEGAATGENPVVAVSPAAPAPNHRCIDCDCEFYSSQPSTKRCPACRKPASMRRLLVSKKRRGERLSVSESVALEAGNQ